MGAAILLLDPKYPHNVGGVLRACAVFGASELRWTGQRVPAPDDWPTGSRLPREERMRLYRTVNFLHLRSVDEVLGTPPPPGALSGHTPICVEVLPSSELLTSFLHPADALYVFGPEDGTIPGAVRACCHRFVTIPTATRTPLNLAAAVNVVLYDRLAKLGEDSDLTSIAVRPPITSPRAR